MKVPAQGLEADLEAWCANPGHARRSAKALDSLGSMRRRHAGIWPTQLPSPPPARAKSWQLVALLEQGLGQQCPESYRSPALAAWRDWALDHDAPAAVHEALDAAGAPFPSPKHCFQLAATAIRSAHLNALQAMHRVHPEPMEATWTQGPALGAMLATFEFLEKPSGRRARMVEWMTLHGAHWENPGIVDLVARKTGEVQDRWQALLRRARALRMEANLPSGRSLPGRPHRL